MATLTSTGINCSDGTLDGQYTGTVQNNTSYPIGSYLLVGYATYAAQTVGRNGTMSVYNMLGFVPFAYMNANTFGSWSILSGTWRQRGGMVVIGSGESEFNFMLAQRVA
jgi:hypothetical protein